MNDDDYGPATYGDRAARDYDDWYSAWDEDAVAMLAGLAGAGPALELGIGTGRVALPLAARGVEVRGVDASREMIERLRAKPGGASLEVSVGDFSDFDLGAQFPLVYVVFNTFFNLTTQEAQLACFRSVARHLAPGGRFVIEAFVPDLTRFAGGTGNRAARVTTEGVELDVAQHHAAGQRVVGQKVVMTDGRVRLYPIRIRYAWPSELDLMARLAGLRLAGRFSGWRREPFADESGKHVSVYERGG